MQQNNAVTEIEERKIWAAATHFSLLLTGFAPVGSLIIPGMIFLKKSEDEFIKRHAVSAINFGIILTVLGLITLGGKAFVLEQVQNAGAVYLLEATSLPFTLLYLIVVCASWIEGITNGIAALKGESPSYKFVLRKNNERKSL